MLSAAAEDEEAVPEKAVSGHRGRVDLFGKSEPAGPLSCGGIAEPDEAAGNNKALDRACRFGRNLKQ